MGLTPSGRDAPRPCELAHRGNRKARSRPASVFMRRPGDCAIIGGTVATRAVPSFEAGSYPEDTAISGRADVGISFGGGLSRVSVTAPRPLHALLPALLRRP